MWKEAMLGEMNSLHKNNTRELSELSKRNKAIGCKWGHAKKQRPQDGANVHCKARLVEKGYAQRESIDYSEVFSPVAKHSSVRGGIDGATRLGARPDRCEDCLSP